MEKRTLHVAFSTQKGGAGKTTLTILVASYFHYVLGYKVAVVDCDYPQFSIDRMRERELKVLESNKVFQQRAQAQLQRLGKKCYPVYLSKPEDVITIGKEVEENDLDFIFYDLPGTVGRSGMISALAMMDYIFAPMSADRLVVEGTLRFAVVLNEALISVGRGNIKGLYMLWNFVDGRERTDLYDHYEAIINQLGISVMKTFLPDSKKFRREISNEERPVFRSTLFPPDKREIRNSNLDLFCEELINSMQESLS